MVKKKKAAGKRKTAKPVKIPDLVAGKFVIVNTDGQAWDEGPGKWVKLDTGEDTPNYGTKEAAQEAIAILQVEPADGIPDPVFAEARIEPLGKFMANEYLVDDAGVLSVRLVVRKDGEKPTTAKQAAKAALIEHRGYFKDLVADLTRHEKEDAAAVKQIAADLRTHTATVAKAEKALAAFEAKVAKYA